MCARAQRQKEVVKNLYAECMALEELLEESVNTLGPDARDILAQIRCAARLLVRLQTALPATEVQPSANADTSRRLYIEQEIFVPENQSPPLGEGHALAAIRAKARNYRRAGTDVGEILQASQRLAHAQVWRLACFLAQACSPAFTAALVSCHVRHWRVVRLCVRTYRVAVDGSLLVLKCKCWCAAERAPGDGLPAAAACALGAAVHRGQSVCGHLHSV